MLELSLHILDIVQNSLAAGADLIEIEIQEDREKDHLLISIRDNGRGIQKENLAKVADPFYTSRKTRRVGLGLSLLQQAALQCEGYLEVKSDQAHGTEVKAYFKHSHVDRMPLGDMAKTMSVLLVGNAQVDFTYRHTVNGDEFRFDTRVLKEHLDGVPLNDHNVVRFIFQEFEEWMKRRNRILREGGHGS